jgi:rare lipoprotein A
MKRLLILLLIIFSTSVRAQGDSVLTGKASFYAKKFEGRRTACGEIFSNKKLTAAHKTLPFGTMVRVTNLKNEKSVIVTINDRLPKKSKRSIDLSFAAADELGFIKAGLAEVKIEIVRDSTKLPSLFPPQLPDPAK